MFRCSGRSYPPPEHLNTRTPEHLNVALFAGEYSGDVQGAVLAAALRERCTAARPPAGPNSQLPTPNPLSLWGIGGARMREAGVELRFDSTHWGAMGTYEALKLAPRLLWVLSRVKRDLLAARPDVLVLIDFGAFNARAAAWAKRQGLRVFYYFPPGSWRRGPIRPGPRSLPAVTDRIATPFPWSEAALREAGADAHFVGHPLLDIARPAMSREAFRARHGIPQDAPLVCYLPGSRRHELRYIWPAMRGAAAMLSQSIPDLAHVVALAPSVQGGRQPSAVSRQSELTADSRQPTAFDLVGTVYRLLSTVYRPPATVYRLPSTVCCLRPPATVYDALAASDLAITKSGTVTLEAAILGRPMVILYRVSPIQEVEYRLLHQGRIRFVGMPNIILDRMAFPELIQHQASPGAIAAAALPFLTDPAVRERADADLRCVRAALGEPGAVRRTADLILDLAGRSPLAS